MVARSDSAATNRAAAIANSDVAGAYRAYVASIESGKAAASASYASKKFKIPAFARKYGLRCSACHTVWPELNSFGQQFRDNGYQLRNEKDSPIAQSNGYIPITLRATPQFHYERATKQVVDATPGDGESGQAERTISSRARSGRTSPSSCCSPRTTRDRSASRRCTFASTTSATARG
jgi:hypothetical protein